MERTYSPGQMTTLFREALEAFVYKVKSDDQVIAAVLMGSLSYDQVWEKSDIDLKLIVQEQKLNDGYMCFVENDVPINTSIQTRNEFKRWIERSVQGSFHHSILVRSTLLFTKDETIEEYFNQIRYIGERDRQLQLVSISSYTLSLLAKAEKWLYVKKDATYSAFWIIKMVDLLSQIEVLLNKDVPMRESVQQALNYNPVFFEDIYRSLMHGSPNEEIVARKLTAINEYLNERAEQLFQPILSFLQEEADIRTVTDIVHKFNGIIQLDRGSVTTACDWLSERGLLSKMEAETKATPKSRIKLLEPAYLFEHVDEPYWGMNQG